MTSDTPTDFETKPPRELQGEDAAALTEAELNVEPGAEGEPNLKAVIDALAARVNELETEAKAARDQSLRAYAEAENVRKRAERQMAEDRQYAIEKFARDLLGVVDNLGRALQTVDMAGRDKLDEPMQRLVDGIDLTSRELAQALARHGVKPVEAAPGAAFDPNKHQAVAQIPSIQPAGSIAELFQGGFEINGRVLRAAMVAVSAGAAN
jgi:molecular chaperone GrpE